ncbi:3,4-dihydroxy-2-butanone-4-phosphate synthase [Pokkaliibacter plantistimulans]|uniref:3,4-dihydroxy-2-butanone 4-phosphate synthase n=1 Tax=Proteobacteria bacterium 228 TaxID=2083153 RepID=A0A2S5KRQ9_9PROT|nr:bifunctional 3,4-dihydroxy-2-butanone-4-phosphate synthase/GTP cyclohydrolase II [Pokkaliibacter plantistimulans]PPC76946.1 3,4-dihydroxy-2-butanone-4-phosphate synthase [Pokkaliibacter plantistimulans]
MSVNSVEEIIEDIRQGKMVILMDDEDRENEGDLILAADKVTPEHINFMAKYARGLICLTLTRERCEYLKLPLMVSANGTPYATNFTVSIEAATGVTTGISAADRARTVQVAVNADSRPEDIVQPGHIFPLMARPGGVLSRAGHTEAGCDLARLAGLTPASVIVEIMNEDGSMARRPDLEEFARTHDLKIGTIADLIHYRTLHEKTIEQVAEAELQTEFGAFKAVTFLDRIQGKSHLALVRGEINAAEPTLVRVHMAEVMRDIIGVQSPGKWTMRSSLQAIAEAGSGVAVLLAGQQCEDLGAALESFVHPKRSRVAQREGGVSGVYQTVGTGSQILRALGVGKMRLLSSPVKFTAISGFDLEIVEYVEAED